MERGQVTIEMIFIFGLFLLLIIGISVPNIFQAERYSRDVQFASDARYSQERIASIASTISNSYERRSAEIYVPGYTSASNSTDNKKLLWFGTCTSVEGSVLSTTIGMVRRKNDGTVTLEETHNFTRDLGAGDWKIYVNTGSGYQEGVIIESTGRRYDLTISWENITSNTVPSYTLTNCSNILSLGGI